MQTKSIQTLKLKDALLQRYLSPFRLTPIDLEELRKQFNPNQVNFLCDSLLEKDYLSKEDGEALKGLGVNIKYLRKWHYPWVMWAIHVLNTRWFSIELSDYARSQIFIELGNLDEHGLSTMALVTFAKKHIKNMVLLEEALFTIGKIGPNAESAVPFLADILKKPLPPNIKLTVIWTLGQMKDQALLAIPSLIQILDEHYSYIESRDRNLREQTINVLTNMSEIIVPDLLENITKPNLQRGIKEIFSKIYNIETKKALLRFMSHKHQPMKNKGYAAMIIQECEKKDILSVISECLSSHHSWDLKVYAIRALGALGPKGKGVLLTLSRILKTEDEIFEVREASIEALQHMGDEGVTVLKSMTRLLDDRVLLATIQQTLHQEEDMAQKTDLSDLHHRKPREPNNSSLFVSAPQPEIDKVFPSR